MNEKKLNILQIVDGFRMGGAETKLCELIERMDTTKFNSHLANVGPAGPLDSRFNALEVPIYKCQRKHGFDIKPVFQLRRIMQEQKIDIVQTTLFWADVVGSIAARLAKVPVVLSWETVTHEGDTYHDKWQRKAGYNLAMKFTDGVVAVSHEVKNSLIKRRGLPPEMIHVIHYGVDLEKFSSNGEYSNKKQELGLPDDDVVIGIVARLEPMKGHKIFVDAFCQLKDKYPGVSVVFVGDGSCRLELEKMAKEAGLEKRIHFLGIRKNVNEILDAIDFFVLPAISGEGLPNVVLEAMACSKPVIATRVGGSPEMIEDGHSGFIVPPENVAALAGMMEKMLCERDKIAWLGSNARRRVEKDFSLQKQINEFEALYKEMYKKKAIS
jgi:glycosyltransferase involved in cell wall biosynthesis